MSTSPSSRVLPRLRTRRVAAAAALLTLGTTTAASAARGATTTVTASIAYTDGSRSTVPVWKDIRVTIKLGDQLLVNDALLPQQARDSVFTAPSLVAVDLDDDAEAEVIVNSFTGSLDCCKRSVVYHRDGVTYDSEVVTWPAHGYRLQNVVGRRSPEFVSADARVPAAWRSTARGPLRVLALRGGKLRDVSRQARRALQRDARTQHKALGKLRRGAVNDARAIVAAYAADLVRLGKIAQARRMIGAAARRHQLRASARSFSRTLDRRFVRWGISSRRVLAR